MKTKLKPAPIQQFIKELKQRDTAALVIEAETPQLDLSKLPPDQQVGVQIRSPSATGTTAASAGTQASEIQPKLPDRKISMDELEMRILNEGDPIPMYWSKGALLNVRNRGDHYRVTLYPEEFDPRHPERSMTFPNSWTCQDFVSRWYARENPDPRAR